jgi:membrane protease YdiL (CAAX protease family)
VSAVFPTGLDVVALAVLLGVLPALSAYQAGLLPGMDVERGPAYLSTAVTLLVLGGGVWWVGSRHGDGEALGLVALPLGHFVLWTAVLVGAGLALTLAFRWAGLALGLREAPVLRALIPVTGREKAGFAGVSVAAGIGEELAYRGYVIPLLAPILGSWGAVALSSAVFGVLHAYQGPLGVARTAAMGAVLAWGFLGSGSLLPPMAAHAVFNIIVGTVLAERLLVPDAPGGVSGR